MVSSGTYYDQIALIMPGSLAIILLGWITGRSPPAVWLEAGAGGLAVLAFGGLAIGFLLTQLANRATNVVWRVFKSPSARCLEENNPILGEPHRKEAIQDAQKVLGLDARPTEEQWLAYFRHCVTEATSGRKAGRVQLFLANYALSRNLALLAMPFTAYAAISQDWLLTGLGTVALVAAASSARFFDRQYVSEVFIAYLGDL